MAFDFSDSFNFQFDQGLVLKLVSTFAKKCKICQKERQNLQKKNAKFPKKICIFTYGKPNGEWAVVNELNNVTGG